MGVSRSKQTKATTVVYSWLTSWGLQVEMIGQSTLLTDGLWIRVIPVEIHKPNPDLRKQGISTPCKVCGHAAGMHKCCNKCGCEADGEEEIGEIFRWRQMRRKEGQIWIPQPWCYHCRGKHPTNEKYKGRIYLQAEKINDIDTNIAVEEISRVMKKLKKELPAMTRLSDPVVRASTKDYEATSMRLTPFSRAANPPAWLIKKFSPIVKREADCAARRYRGLCHYDMVDKEDLYSIGLVYLCTYLHRHQNLTNEAANGGALTMFLRQEFKRWAVVTHRRLMNVQFSAAGVPLDEVLGSPDENVEMTVVHGPFKESFYAYKEPVDNFLDAECDQEVKNIGKGIRERKLKAGEDLDGLLAGMSHEKYVLLLDEVVKSEYHPEGARKEASKRLAKHQETCQECKSDHKHS